MQIRLSSNDCNLILAASIIRMLYHSLSEEIFTNGMKIFLNQSSVNSFQQQPFNCWQQAANDGNLQLEEYSIEELIDGWRNQEGYPIVFAERSYNDHRVRFTQAINPVSL